MFESYVDVIEASRILGVHPETVKRLIREGKLTATKFGNKWIIECWQSAQVGQIRTREDYYYEELRGSSLRVLL